MPRERVADAEAPPLTAPVLTQTLPSVDLDNKSLHIEEWAGLRPATEHDDYCISVDEQRNCVTVGGIRSTGTSEVSATPALLS